MEDMLFETPENPEVHITASGQLSVTGWDQPQVKLQTTGKSENITATQDGSQINIKADEAVSIHVPHDAQVYIENAYSDVLVRGVHSTVNVGAVYGKLVLKDFGPLVAEQVNGAFNAAQANGSIKIKSAFGPVNVSGVAGDFHGETLSGNLTLTNLDGNLNVTTRGNCNLNLAPTGPNVYNATGYGKMFVRVPKDLDAKVKINSRGLAVVKVGEVSKRILSGSLDLVFGDGTAEINLDAYGVLNLLEEDVMHSDAPKFDFAFDFENNIPGLDLGDLSQVINEQLQAQLEQINMQVEQFSNMAGQFPGISTEKAEEIARKAQEKADRARERVQQAAERAQAKMERRMADAQRRMGREQERLQKLEERFERKTRRGFNFEFNTGGRTQASTSATEEEKLAILKMLAENKITAEEADKLLQALGG